MTEEIFLVQKKKGNTFYESRRNLAYDVVAGYVFNSRDPMPVIVRFQRVPGKTANADIAPDIKSYFEELPSYAQSRSSERTALVDAMEAHISSLLN